MQSEVKKQKQANRKSFNRYIKKLQWREARYVTLRDKAAAIQPLYETIKRLQTQVAELHKQIRSIEGSRDYQIAQLRNHLVDKDNQIAELKNGETIKQLTDQLTQLTESSADEIRLLNERLERVKFRIIEQSDIDDVISQKVEGMSLDDAFSAMINMLGRESCYFIKKHGSVSVADAIRRSCLTYTGYSNHPIFYRFFIQVIAEHWMDQYKIGVYQSTNFSMGDIDNAIRDIAYLSK